MSVILGEDADVYGFETADSEDESEDESEEDWEPKKINKTKKTKKAKKTKEKTKKTEEWNAPYQILWDTPPTFNRTELEMVCILAMHVHASVGSGIECV